MPNVANSNLLEAKEAYTTVLEMARLLGLDLDHETLTICIRLCEAGVNPQSLANLLQFLRAEVDNVSNKINENVKNI